MLGELAVAAATSVATDEATRWRQNKRINPDAPKVGIEWRGIGAQVTRQTFDEIEDGLSDSEWRGAGWISKLLVGVPLGLIAAWVILVWGYRFSLSTSDVAGGLLLSAAGFFGMIAAVWFVFWVKEHFGSWRK